VAAALAKAHGGTLAVYGARGDALASALAAALGLQAPAITWRSARDSFARLGSGKGWCSAYVQKA